MESDERNLNVEAEERKENLKNLKTQSEVFSQIGDISIYGSEDGSRWTSYALKAKTFTLQTPRA